MFAPPPPLPANRRPLSASCTIKSQLRCVLSRSTSSLSFRPTTPAVRQPQRKQRTARVGGASTHQITYNRSKGMEGKRRRNSNVGVDEEKRVMTILHNLHALRNNPTLLTELYVKPLPEYIREKLKHYADTDDEIERVLRQQIHPPPIIEEPYQNNALNEGTPPDKIQLPEKRPMITSRWQQKMLTKLERMEQASTSPSPVPPLPSGTSKQVSKHPPPFLSITNRQLSVLGQGSPSTTKTIPSRYKPPIPVPPSSRTKYSAFSYSDPLPVPVSYLSHRQEPLSPFEERLLELEKLERDSVAIERNAKPKAAKGDATTRIPATLMTQQQPKYLDSTIAYQIRVANQKRPTAVRSTPSPVKTDKRRTNSKHKTGKIALVTRS